MTPESVAGLWVGGSVLDVMLLRIGLALWPAPRQVRPANGEARPDEDDAPLEKAA